MRYPARARLVLLSKCALIPLSKFNRKGYSEFGKFKHVIKAKFIRDVDTTKFESVRLFAYTNIVPKENLLVTRVDVLIRNFKCTL